MFYESFTITEYYFEVKKASYWQSKLDYEKTNPIDDGFIGEILNFAADFGVPNGIENDKLDMTLGIIELIKMYGGDFIGDSINHKTDLSEYLFLKVIYKNPDDDVAILKSATTHEGTKAFWEDSLKLEKTSEKFFY